MQGALSRVFGGGRRGGGMAFIGDRQGLILALSPHFLQLVVAHDIFNRHQLDEQDDLHVPVLAKADGNRVFHFRYHLHLWRKSESFGASQKMCRGRTA